MKIDIPKIGGVWERDGLRREVIDVVNRSARENDYNIIWARPGSDRKTVIWLPYWKQWLNKAHKVF